MGTDVTKLVALELGGKNTSIIHQDANIDHALPELLRACFLSTGQRCTSTSVSPVHRSIIDPFMEQFKNTASKIIVDHAVNYQVEPFMGPLIDQAAVDKYSSSLKLGLESGAEEILPHQELELTHKGHYLSPSIFRIEKALKDTLILKKKFLDLTALLFLMTKLKKPSK